MSPGTTPDGSGDAALSSVSGRAGAEAVTADQPEERSAEWSARDPEPSAPAERRRLQALAGVTVYGSDGKTVGRVRDVYLHDAIGELAAITVMPRQLSADSVLIPASAI
ncbi:MAG: PRC-barrel domain-containing protein, partial [Brachybacterium sp.]|nr:PRC-barrel domain-containing protein [Brachybacterium sp.]